MPSYAFTAPGEVRAKLASLTTESLETIAEMIVNLEHALEEMTEERDELQQMVNELEAEA